MFGVFSNPEQMGQHQYVSQITNPSAVCLLILYLSIEQVGGRPRVTYGSLTPDVRATLSEVPNGSPASTLCMVRNTSHSVITTKVR